MSMSPPLPPPGPERGERLREALRELDASSTEVAAWLPVAQRLGEWPERTIRPADTNRLLSALASLVPRRSVVREAVRERFARRRGGLVWLLDTARVQVSILRPSFWLLSAAIALFGIYTEMAAWDTDAVFYVRAFGPLLAYLGITAIFRGVRLRMIECEIGCPPSALQLTIARLVIVLGYDSVLGLCLGLALWLRGMVDARGDVSFLALTLHWLTPLLLVAGLALVLSLRLSVSVAAGLAYLSWLAALSLFYAISASNAGSAVQPGPHVAPYVPLGAEIALGLAGLALLGVGTWRLPASISRRLPTG